jgi:hypothetical protein
MNKDMAENLGLWQSCITVAHRHEMLGSNNVVSGARGSCCQFGWVINESTQSTTWAAMKSEVPLLNWPVQTDTR